MEIYVRKKELQEEIQDRASKCNNIDKCAVYQEILDLLDTVDFTYAQSPVERIINDIYASLKR
jgi:hypothetical protein